MDPHVSAEKLKEPRREQVRRNGIPALEGGGWLCGRDPRPPAKLERLRRPLVGSSEDVLTTRAELSVPDGALDSHVKGSLQTLLPPPLVISGASVSRRAVLSCLILGRLPGALTQVLGVQED